MFLRPLLTPGLRASWPDIVRKPTLLQMSGVAQARCGIVTSARLLCEVTDGEEAKKQVDPAKDRSKVVPVEVSVKYMKTQAYQTTYGSDPVWKRYRRNFKGGFPPQTTRKTCIRAKVITTGNPCPICRDEYLVLDYRNVDLLNQFISPHNGAVLPVQKTHLCRNRHRELQVAVEKARDYGLLTYDVPFHEYDYSEYFSPVENKEKSTT
ncbi:28S ribosomal protein S18b, mitochondrial-like [Homarus americanus]|uniref:28S ribosomal protein S18b, mitochondrial-like n=1 Tax=Homarus americanus TaxID=6706 RepID=UPI001C47DC3C|nr:28S ribosomal protein S18b, mitochondrial-like [Homarus americanus]